jgi:branched-chain amino acid transport system substrate-binding protein
MQRRFGLSTAALLPIVAAIVVGVALIFWLTAGASAFGSGNTGNAGVIRIYSSVPLNSYASIVHGAQMAFDEANNQAGDFKLEYVPLNDAPTIDGHWDAGVELNNARRAVEDPDAMVYLGTYNSGAAKISIPVLNRVHMAMVSPGNTYPGLTKPGTGTAGEPWTYFPLGIRNYFRVVPADDLQGSAAAAYAKQLGSKSVYVLDDTELYGHGIAVIFAQSARDLGLNVLGGPESIDVHASSYSALASKIVALKPDLVYFGGITDNHPAQVLRDLRSAGYNGAFMGADGITDDKFIQEVGADASQPNGPVLSTLVGLPAAKLSGDGANWYQKYISQYRGDNNVDFAPFGYEAAKVAISAISKVNKKDREAIRAQIAKTTSADLAPPHILGDWSFDANGDTSLVTISVQQLGTQWQYQGLMVYDPQAKTWQFQQTP